MVIIPNLRQWMSYISANTVIFAAAVLWVQLTVLLQLSNQQSSAVRIRSRFVFLAAVLWPRLREMDIAKKSNSWLITVHAITTYALLGYKNLLHVKYCYDLTDTIVITVYCIDFAVCVHCLKKVSIRLAVCRVSRIRVRVRVMVRVRVSRVRVS